MSGNGGLNKRKRGPQSPSEEAAQNAYIENQQKKPPLRIFQIAAEKAGIATAPNAAAAIKKFAGGTTPNNVLAILALSVKTSKQEFARHDDFLRYDRKKKTKHEYEVITYTYKSFVVTVKSKTTKHYFSVQVGYEEPTKIIQLKVVDTLQEPRFYVRPLPLVWTRTLDHVNFEKFKELHAALDESCTIKTIIDTFSGYFVDMKEEKSERTTAKDASDFIKPRIIALEQRTMSSFTDNCIA